MTLANPLQLFDLAVVRHLLAQGLHDQGLRLDAASVYTQAYHPLQIAIQSLASQNTWYTIIGAAETNVLLQFRVQDGSVNQAHLQWLSPDPSLLGHISAASTLVWLDMLNQSATTAGQRGCHYILAEIDPEHPVVELFREAGYYPVTRQVCLKLPSNATPSQAADNETWQAIATPTWTDVNQIYAHTVPTMLQRIELPPTANHIPKYWAWQSTHPTSQKLLGFAVAQQGSQGVYIKPYFAANAHQFIAPILSHPRYARQMRQSLTVCIRQYQSHLASELLAAGWQIASQQVVLAKRLVVSTEPLKAFSQTIEPILSTQSIATPPGNIILF